MAIWAYGVNRITAEADKYGTPPLFFEAHNQPTCVYCQEPLTILRKDFFPNAVGYDHYSSYLIHTTTDVPINPFSMYPSIVEPRVGGLSLASVVEHIVRVCPTCGWWIAFQETVQRAANHFVVNTHGGIGGLIEFAVGGVDVPLRELRQFLCAKYESRFEVHPRVMEETVASVFRDIGFKTRVTAYSGDDGIDVVLDGPDDQMIGVQVKRYRSTITVEQLRALTGALVLNGLTSGMFVTTSGFTSGAARTLNVALTRGIRIDLYDAKRFYQALKLAQRAAYRPDDQQAPFSKPLPLLRTSSVPA